MTSGGRVAIGAPVYNRATHLREAIESLLLQDYTNFRLLLVDDCSTDETPSILEEYAKLDPRVTWRHNVARLGYIRSARRSFELTCELFPAAEYFAWASDHDVWHPRWLGSLVQALDRHPEVVLAYPLNIRIGDMGEVIRATTWSFDTFGVATHRRRVWRTCRGMSAGNMVYGLYRREALARSGALRPVLLPDRLLMAELAAHGQFIQVPEILWYRRYAGLASMQRQIAASFFDERPFHLRLPWSLTHAGYLMGVAPIRRRGRATLGGFQLAGIYLSGSLLRRASHWVARKRKGLRKFPTAVRTRISSLARLAGPRKAIAALTRGPRGSLAKRARRRSKRLAAKSASQ